MFRLVALAFVVVALCSCDRAPAGNPFGRPPSSQTATPQATLLPALPAARARASEDPGPPWSAVVMQDADPRVRRFALEQWARSPSEPLDLVSAGLVDPDESIRERAEQLFEEALARKR